MIATVLRASPERLFAGGLVGPVAACLCLVGFWHVYLNVHPSNLLLGRLMLVLFSVLMVAGSAMHTLWAAKGLALKYCYGSGAPCSALLAATKSYWTLAFNLGAVPGFRKLHEGVQNQQYSVVYVDVDETRAGLTLDYESAFIRSLLVSSEARVLNAYSDDEGAFQKALKRRCGERAREYEVTDSSDVVCFFPSLSREVVATALRRELQDPAALEAGHLQPINNRIDALKASRPYAGGGRPFVEDRLSAEWQRRNT